VYSPVFAKNTSVSRIFGESSSKMSAGGGILGKDERVNLDVLAFRHPEPRVLGVCMKSD